MKKSVFLRVVPSLKFLSEMSAEAQEKWQQEIHAQATEIEQFKTYIKDMASRNEELTRKSDEAKNSSIQLNDLLKKLSEENEKLRFKLQHKENQLDSVNLRMQTVETELEGGAKIKIQVPKPQMRIDPSQFERRRIIDDLNQVK